MRLSLIDPTRRSLAVFLKVATQPSVPLPTTTWTALLEDRRYNMHMAAKTNVYINGKPKLCPNKSANNANTHPTT